MRQAVCKECGRVVSYLEEALRERLSCPHCGEIIRNARTAGLSGLPETAPNSPDMKYGPLRRLHKAGFGTADRGFSQG